MNLQVSHAASSETYNYSYYISSKAAGINMQTLQELHFSPRQRDIIRLLLLGNYPKKIAGMLHITPGTLHNYISNLYLATGSHCMSEFMSFLIRSGFAVDSRHGIVTRNGMPF